MGLSIFLAKLIGLYLIIVSIGIFSNQRVIKNLMNEIVQHPTILFSLGFVSVLAGLAIVLGHNIWQWHWVVLITVLGWLELIRGTIRVVFPEQLVNTITRLLENYPNIINWAAGVSLILGLFLTYKGFTA